MPSLVVSFTAFATTALSPPSVTYSSRALYVGDEGDGGIGRALSSGLVGVGRCGRSMWQTGWRAAAGWWMGRWWCRG